MVLAPAFFVVFFIPQWFGVFSLGSVIVLWALFLLIEFTDVFDGAIARGRGQVTDLGRLFDPFADVFCRLTYFVAFAVTGIMPVWIFMIIVYREFSITFLRLVVYKRGLALGARQGGKLKSVLYFLSAFASLAVVTMERADVLLQFRFHAGMTTIVLYMAAALLALLSFGDYVRVALRESRKTKA
jgi:CDP-diacylglycerol--glycerol-3-phosphate 3-phosphatidyltransferase